MTNRPVKKRPSLKKTCPECGALNPSSARECAECGVNLTSARQARRAREAGGDAFAAEKRGVESGVIGGVVMLVIAAVWFFVGWQSGVIFFYPPILALIGVYAIIKGLATGNMSGKGNRRQRGRRRR